MQKELIDMLERVLQEAITQDPFQGDDYALLHEAEALLAKAKAAQQSVQPTIESGRVLPAKKSNRKGSAPAKSG